MGSIITITTDFGTSDGYQGVLEGVIAGINPAARIVTLTHDLSPGDITGGWYLLKTHYPFFPPGTVHLAVIDPGVGNRRKIIAIQTSRHVFVGPDNGLFSFIPDSDIVSIHSITNRKYALREISPVFHGRDIMAPAAAYLSLGVYPSCLGRPVKKMIVLKVAHPVKIKGGWKGTVLRVDRFGNLITNITAWPVNARVFVSGRPVGPIRHTFSDVKTGAPVAYVGSGGHLEIAVRDGSAADYFGVVKREDVEITVAGR